MVQIKQITLVGALVGLAFMIPAQAEPFFFSTGNPDGLIGTLSRPASGTLSQTETADDFILSRKTSITQATFVGFLPQGSPLTSISDVEIEFYRVFPLDSVNPPSGNVPSRVNSPSDNEIGSATRDSVLGTLSFIATVLNPSFSVANTVVDGINKPPNQLTGGEGPTTGEEVLITANFTLPVDLPANHYYFRPEVGLTVGNFLWLSAPKPIVAPGTPLTPDLQTWIRNDALSPDWLRVGTDITGRGPFNATFSLTGQIPEPTTLALLGIGLAGLGFSRRRNLR